MKRILLGCSSVSILLIAVYFNTAAESTSNVEVIRLTAENWDQYAPKGKEVDAIIGDIVIRNPYLTAVIAQPLAGRNANMTVRDVGGCLIDLTIRNGQSDQLSAFYPGRKYFPYRSGGMVLNNNQEQSWDQVSYHQGEAAKIVVRSSAGNGKPSVEVSYELGRNDRALGISSRIHNPEEKPLTIRLEDEIRADGGKEEMKKSPNGNSRFYWIHDQFWNQAYGVSVSEPLTMTYNSDARTSLIRYAEPNKTIRELKAKQTVHLRRSIFPAAHLWDARSVLYSLEGRKTWPVKMSLRYANGDLMPHALVSLTREGKSWGTARLNEKSVVSGHLPVGTYRVGFNDLGVSVPADKSSYTIRVAEGANSFNLEATSPNIPGVVQGEITDANGMPISCKVEFQPVGGTPKPDFGPESGDDAIKNVQYATHGVFERRIPSGTYKVIVSHGPEFDALYQELKVAAGETTELKGILKRTVNTAGWISSDFHSHSSPSGDNTGSQKGRVINLVCEHIEFAPCTEHNRINSYQPHIDSLKIGQWISTVSGMELTGSPLLLNHQNVFPLVHRPHTQDGGAPLTDLDPEKQIERVAFWDNRSEKLIQQNHPDIGWLFYDRNGDGKPDKGFSRSFPYIDVMEIHPIHNVWKLVPFEPYSNRKGNNRIFNWLQLLNQGFRIYGVVNTDAHYNFHGSGGLRNWIQSSTDDPANIDAKEMVQAAEQGRLIMSNGPYLEVKLNQSGNGKTITAGQDLSVAGESELILQVKVQAANWVNVDRVMVLVNGKPHPMHNYTRETDPALFRSSVSRFDEKLKLTLKQDAHLIVVAGSDSSTLGPVMGPFWGTQKPTAISNPMFVDVDGGGFKANGDTLGYPLPVKFGTR